MSKEVEGQTVGKSSPVQIDELTDRIRAAESALNEITELKRSIDSHLISVNEAKALIDAAVADSRSKAAEVAAITAQAVAAQTQIAGDQAVIAAKSDHIQKAQEHADTVRSNLDRALTAAKQQQTETEGFRAHAQSAADTCTQILAETSASKASSEKDAVAVRTSLEQAKEFAAQSKKIADKAVEIESRVAAYESRLAEFEATSIRQLKAIEGLLPGATSAGLAYAFDERRKTFLNPGTAWQKLFVGSLVLLVILAVTGLLHVYLAKEVLSYDALFRLWLARLPIAGALVWLALYASRESALAKRLEEDYGYKAVVAASFEGFHKQMSEISTGADPHSPLVKLCSDTLATIASPPGRIYDKHALTISPSSELTDAARTFVEVARTAPPTSAA